MLTRGIIEDVLSPYKVKVRIPLLHRMDSANIATTTEDLNTATICSMPNCYINPQVGDIVFVAFEDNTYYKAVILGHLSRAAMTNTYGDFSMNSLLVNSSAKLPEETTIGSITSEELLMLSGLEGNIQKQLNNIKEQIEQLQTAVLK